MHKIPQDDFNEFIKKQEKQQIESKHLASKVEEYKQKIETGNFCLNIKWETDINKIDLGTLKTSLNDDIKNNLVRDYEIITFNLDKVVSRNCNNPEEVFPKDNLWVERRLPHRIARLIKFVENGNKIIPPIIQPINNKNLAIIDGNHRIALCRFLKLNCIPFLITKNSITFIDDLK